ncbi:hypothetical protein ABIE41_000130 [Bosea sp. OAE506]
MAVLPSDEFQRPVVVLTAFGHPTAISTAMEAYMFLVDFPPSRQDAIHKVTANACLATVSGEIATDTARGLFASWAERNGILAPDVAAFVPNGRNGSHGVA